MGGSFLLVPVRFTEGNHKIHVLIKKELNKKLDEGPSKKGKSEPDEESDDLVRLFIRL